MKRKMVKIDEDLCNGCGDCIPNCHEGALQIVDGKVRLISDLFCDGLGACMGHCPVGAITIEEREAQPYDEAAVLKEMIPKGENTILAHLKHLQDHGEIGYLRDGIEYLEKEEKNLPFNLQKLEETLFVEENTMNHDHGSPCGCPGSAAQSFERNVSGLTVAAMEAPSELTQWPIQLHLINPMAPYFANADLLIAADCVAFSVGAFHQKYLKGRKLVIACPKLDENKESYVQKFIALINNAKVNTISVMMMEVPCCGGLLQLVQMAMQQASRKVPVKAITIGLKGDVLAEEWV